MFSTLTYQVIDEVTTCKARICMQSLMALSFSRISFSFARTTEIKEDERSYSVRTGDL